MPRPPKLSVELVPSNQWGSNLRSVLSRGQWDRLRKASYERAGNVCEICGQTGFQQGRNRAVECHEIWSYDDENRIQKLEGVISLCPRCHQVKHLGRSLKVGAGRVALAHLMEVNGWTPERTAEYVESVFVLHEVRSVGPSWTLDLAWLAHPESMLAPHEVEAVLEKIGGVA
jgi:hypothetical protein